jgi:polo-like kinase 1
LKPKTKQKLQSEIRIHKAVSHKNIVQFYHAFENEYNVYILLEVCASSNMYELIRKRKKLTVPEVQYYIFQLVQALSYLHNSMVIHRDVKLGNLFINDKMELKLGDFGLAAKLEFPGERKRTVCGTPNYIAPEIIENLKGHSFEVDIWSTGVIMYIFLTGHPPFETDNLEKTYKRIKAGDFTIPSSMNKEAGDLLKKMLVVDPAKRATF